MTRRKWVLRVGLVAAVAVGAAGTWAAMNFAQVKAMVAARQFRTAATDDERNRAADRLAALGEPGVKRLVESVRSGTDPQRAAAAGALGRHLAALPDGAQPAVTISGQLLDASASCDAAGQRAVLELLPVVLKKTGNAHSARCRAAVAAGLAMPDPGARVLAARLALHPDLKLRAELLPLLSAPEPEVRRAALVTASTPGDGEPLVGDEELFRWLHDPDEGVRRVCRDSLVVRGRSETEISLGRRLADPDPLERLKLLLDLRYDDDVADPEPWLERLSRDPDPAVRAGAARVAVEVTADRRQTCPGWVAKVAFTDGDGTVRRVAGYFHRLPGVSDPSVKPAGAP